LGTNSASGVIEFITAIETANTIPLAGQTVTLSAYIASTLTSTSPVVQLAYSTSVDNGVNGTYTTISPTTIVANPTMSTSFQRYISVYAIPSTAKTLQVLFNSGGTVSSTGTFALAGVQLEVGSVATAFSRAGGTLQGELNACMRYYWQASNDQGFFSGQTTSGSTYWAYYRLPVPMRIAPTVTLTSADAYGFNATSGSAGGITTTGFYESRNATFTQSSSYFGSSVVASAEL